MVHGRGYEHEFPGLPVDGLRGERILTALVREGLIGHDAVLHPHAVSFAKLDRVHDTAYLERVATPEVIEAAFGLRLPASLCEAMVELQRCVVGGTVLAARAAWRQHKLAINLGGGFHHGHRDRGRGFCLFNDIAVAIAQLRANNFRDPIVVVDLDLHDGDGTRAIFANDPSVWTFSLHNEHWGPTEARRSTAVALGEGVDDREYLEAIEEYLPEVLERQRPGLVFYLAGCDPAADDELGNWSISEEGMLARDRLVMGMLRARGVGSVVWLLGGGYGRDAWRYSARGLIACMGGPRSPSLPTTEAITLARFRTLAEIIDPRELSGQAPGELVFEETDLFGAGMHPGFGEQPRMLGFYTRQGVEFALERYGLLARLRDLGFEPRVELEEDPVEGDTLRVFGDAQRECVVIETRLSRDRRTIPSMELLRIEWLLLQNPRASWLAGRVALPGQRYPGLRMFDEIAILMMMICERLRLDGIVVVPSHYHVARRWHGRMKFLDPVVEGRFRALSRVLSRLPLDEASAAVERRRVIDLDSGERGGYSPSALVLPASEALERRFDADWERQAAEAEAAARFEVEARWIE
ncbi:histone deacetylase [Pseudenhygromyxa sp. WMMC2535]|nr:histone deacetylase [Pseudenhygromyxa sp. WMMC2535]